MSTQTARIPAVFAAHDAGIADLPGELIDARQAVARLDAALADLGPPPQQADVRANKLAQALADKARTGDVTVDVAELEALEAAGRDHSRRASVARQARDLAAQNLGVLAEDWGDEIIEHHLAPALDVLVADMKAAVGKCGDSDLSDRAMLSAPKSVRDGWLALDDTRTRYGVIRSVRAALVRTADADRNDVTGIFAEVKNAEQVWPDVGRDGVSHTLLRPEKAPWHDPDPKLRLVKLLQAGAVLWVPTVEQQERRWTEVYGARLEEAKLNRQRLAGSRYQFG